MSILINSVIYIATGATVALFPLSINYLLSQNKARRAERRSVMVRLKAFRTEIWIVLQRLKTNEILSLASERECTECPQTYSRDDFIYYRNISEKYSMKAIKVMKDFHSLLIEADAVFRNDKIKDLCSTLLSSPIPKIDELPKNYKTLEVINMWREDQSKKIMEQLNSSNLLMSLDELNKRIKELTLKSKKELNYNNRIYSFLKGLMLTIIETFKD